MMESFWKEFKISRKEERKILKQLKKKGKEKMLSCKNCKDIKNLFFGKSYYCGKMELCIIHMNVYDAFDSLDWEYCYNCKFYKRKETIKE